MAKKKTTSGNKKNKLPSAKEAGTGTAPGNYEETHFIRTDLPVWNYTMLSDEDVLNFQNGTHYRLYEKFGSHAIRVMDQPGMYFCVWAPNATEVYVIGNFNNWQPGSHPLQPRWDKSGIWEGFIPGFQYGETYKYHIVGYAGRKQDKGDPS